jgi:small subunit ribosomal protein S19
MSRSLKKPLFVNEKLRKKIEKLRSQIAELEKQKGKEGEIAKILFTPIKVWCRDSTIFPEMIGFTVMIHKGGDKKGSKKEKFFIKHLITEGMVNRKLGEFAPTRKIGIHGKAGTH